MYFGFAPSSVIDRADEPLPKDKHPDTRRALFRQLVKDAPDVLAALAVFIARLAAGDPAPSTETTTMSQKQMRQSRRAAAKANPPLDPAPFERLDIPVPKTREDAESAASLIFEKQKAILEVGPLSLDIVLFNVESRCTWRPSITRNSARLSGLHASRKNLFCLLNLRLKKRRQRSPLQCRKNSPQATPRLRMRPRN